MNSSWHSTYGTVPLSPNSTFASRSTTGGQELSALSQSRNLLVEMSVSGQQGQQSTARRLAFVENPAGLIKGIQQVHGTISRLVEDQRNVLTKTDALEEEADLYSLLLRKFQERQSGPLSTSISESNRSSEIENARSTPYNLLRRPIDQQIDELAVSKAQSEVLDRLNRDNQMTTDSLVDVQRLPSKKDNKSSRLVLSSVEGVRSHEKVSRSSYSLIGSEILDEPLASSSPISKSSAPLPEDVVAQLTQRQKVSNSSVRVRSPETKSKAVQVSPKVADAAIATGSSLTEPPKKAKKKKKSSRSVKDASVQVSFEKPLSLSQISSIPDEGFCEPSEPLSSSDRKENPTQKQGVVLAPEHRSPTTDSAGLPYSCRPMPVTLKNTFVAGTSTSASHSVYVAAQQLMHAVKLNHPFLFAALSKGKVSQTVDQFLASFIAHAEKELDRMCDEIRLDIRIYDQIDKELSDCKDGDRVEDLKVRQAELAARITQKDFQVRKLQSKVDAAKCDLKVLVNKTGRPPRSCAYGWLRPTLASLDKASSRVILPSSRNFVQSDSINALREMKAIEQFINRNGNVLSDC